MWTKRYEIVQIFLGMILCTYVLPLRLMATFVSEERFDVSYQISGKDNEVLCIWRYSPLNKSICCFHYTLVIKCYIKAIILNQGSESFSYYFTYVGICE